jgi:hypothetical protein
MWRSGALRTRLLFPNCRSSNLSRILAAMGFCGVAAGGLIREPRLVRISMNTSATIASIFRSLHRPIQCAGIRARRVDRGAHRSCDSPCLRAAPKRSTDGSLQRFSKVAASGVALACVRGPRRGRRFMPGASLLKSCLRWYSARKESVYHSGCWVGSGASEGLDLGRGAYRWAFVA